MEATFDSSAAATARVGGGGLLNELPRLGVMRGFGIEALLTLILVSVVLGTAARPRRIGAYAAIASGGAVALCSLFSGSISGASTNPARSLAPALVSGELHDLWSYLAVPFARAALTTFTMCVLHAAQAPVGARGGAGPMSSTSWAPPSQKVQRVSSR
jgi:glycerol uptake facilitator-like aquaporin